LIDRNEHIQAAQQFEAAIRQGDNFQAYYYLAELNSQAAQRDSTCPLATAFYKLVSERGDWDTAAPWWEAERAWTRGDLERALLGYWIMAERGYEVAQNNVAHILDQNKRRLSLPYYDLQLGNMTERLALMFWTRSAAQDNVDALVKMGDYYLKGLGVPSGIPQPEKAAACYGSAASTQVSSLAMHNLGWMHENGIGVSQDFHLAKRYYDLSLETNTEAYLPVTLSLIKLHIRSLYKAVMAGDIKAISLFLSNEYWIDESGVAEQEGTAPAAKPWLWSWRRIRDEFFKRWIGEEMARQQAQRQIQQQEARVGQAPPVDAPARQGQLDPTQAQNARAALESQDDPVEWARRRREDMLQQDDLADDLDIPDFFGDTIGGRGRDGGDDLIETVAILGLCLVLGWLVYIRQARYDGARARRTPTNPVAAQAPTRAQADEAAAAAPTHPASIQNVQQEQGEARQQDRPVP
jgi:SEL1 protein